MIDGWSGGWSSYASNSRGSVLAALVDVPALVHVGLCAVRAGASVDEVDNHGNTALHLAARFGHELIVDTLLAAGADTLKCALLPPPLPSTLHWTLRAVATCDARAATRTDSNAS